MYMQRAQTKCDGLATEVKNYQMGKTDCKMLKRIMPFRLTSRVRGQTLLISGEM